MLKISVYHWLPLTDNILPEIAQNLRGIGGLRDIDLESEFISYEIELESGIVMFGNINSRSFAQHVFELPPIPGHTLRDTLHSSIPQITAQIADLLFKVLTRPVQNKSAVLTEGIVSFTEFEATSFDLLTDVSAKRFLMRNHITVIQVDSFYKEDIRIGFAVPSLNLNLNRSSRRTKSSSDAAFVTAISDDDKYFLFYAENGRFNEDDGRFNTAFFKYAAVILLDVITSRDLQILKLVKDHVIPLRRRLVVALQKNTEDHFSTMTDMKKYLTYVNIKLPVMEKIQGYLKLTIKTHPELYNGIKQTFNVAHLNEFPNIALIAKEIPHLDPNMIVKKVEVDFERLGELFEENEKEIEVISNEVSQVLQGNLLAQNTQILDRDLDTSQAVLELDRGGKNRSNALKVLSVVLSANLGVAFGGEIASILERMDLAGIFKIGGAIVTVIISWIYIEKFIADKAGHFRLVIPVRAEVPGHSLTYLTHSRKLKKMDSNGSRRRRSWVEQFETEDMHKLSNRKNNRFERRNSLHNFEVTIDYEKRGLIHSIMLETEAKHIQFSSCPLVIQVFKRLREAGCLERPPKEETSLLVEALSYLNVLIELKVPAELEAAEAQKPLVALNRLLTISLEEMQNILQVYRTDPGDTTLSQEDRMLFRDVNERRDFYIRWLQDVQRDKSKEVEHTLLGKYNVESKKRLLEMHTGGQG